MRHREVKGNDMEALMPDIPGKAVQAAAGVLLCQYEAMYGPGDLTWRDFAGQAREIVDAVTPHLVPAEAEAAELSRRIDDLRAFEREYRSRLDAYVEGLLKDLRRSM